MRANRVSAIAISLVAIAASGATAYAATSEYDGPMRFESTTITVSSTVPGVDLHTVTAPWEQGGTVKFVIVDGPADVEFAPKDYQNLTGAEATRTFVDGTMIGSCEVGVEVALPMVLTHELGHCLGLGHSKSQKKTSIMYWIGGGTTEQGGGSSETVTPADLADLAGLYN